MNAETPRRRRMAMARWRNPNPTEHWTSLRCWRDSGEELSAHERIAILRLLHDGRGELVPDDVLFFDPLAWTALPLPPELCRVPDRNEVDWAYFPFRAVSSSPPPPCPTVERALTSAGSLSALSGGPSGAEPPNAPPPERPQGQATQTYPFGDDAERSEASGERDQ